MSERAGLVTEWNEKEHDIRVSAFNLGSQHMLSRMGVWSDIERRRVSHYTRMYVWDAGSNGKIEFDCAELGVTHLGTIVENSLVTFALHEKLIASDNVRLLPNTELESVDRGNDGISLTLSNADNLRGKVLVGADGAKSSVRKVLGIKSSTKSFGQSGIVAQVSTAKSHGKTAWQRFLRTGPLAFLPLSNGDCSIVWSCEQEMADELMHLNDTDFAQRLTQAFGSQLGEVLQVGPRRTFLLSSTHVARYVENRSVLVGDAAHVIHPLAGQGVNLGMADAAALAESLIEARKNDKDIGARLTLRRYERWRKGDNFIMGCAVSGLKQLFGSNAHSVAKLRGMGLRLVDLITPVKSGFAIKAMGLSGDLPEIMRQ